MICLFLITQSFCLRILFPCLDFLLRAEFLHFLMLVDYSNTESLEYIDYGDFLGVHQHLLPWKQDLNVQVSKFLTLP